MKEDLLDIYPVRAMEYEENEGLITILFINPNPNFFERFFFKKQIRKPKKIDLDNIGSFIWRKCDGKIKIKQIIELVQTEFDEKVENAEERVLLFMKQLSRGRLINLFKKEKI